MEIKKIADGLRQGLQGVLAGDETWGGSVRIEGDVIVAKGATLRIAPGTQVVFAAALAGRKESPSALIVFGRLIVAGTQARPATIAGSGTWGGISVMPGGQARLRHVRLENAEAGLVLTRARAAARAISFSVCKEALGVREGSVLMLDGALFENGGTGLAGASSKVVARNVVFKGLSGTALSLQGSSIRLAECRIERCRIGMILAGGDSRFAGLTIGECREMGVYAPIGRHRFTRYRGTAIVFEAQARVELDGRPLSAAAPARSQDGSILLRLVLRTRNIGIFRGIYRALYSLGEFSFTALAGALGNVVSCDVWRGVKRGDWGAGVSDIDFIVVARELSGTPGKAWLAGLWKRHALFKRAMPFLGETLVVSKPELQGFLEFGGARAPELAGAVRHSMPGPFREPKSQIASWTESAHSYGRLLEWLWLRKSYPWDFRREQIFKSALDVLRHLPSDAAGLGPIHPSRRLFWENIGATPFSESRAVLRFLLEGRPSPDREVVQSAELWAHVLRAMHCGAPQEEDGGFPEAGAKDFVYVPAPRAEPGDVYGAALERWNPQLRRFQDRFGDGLSGALFSDLYPSYAILEDAEMTRPGLAAALAGWAEAEPSGGLTLLLSRRLWRSWSRLPFAENPLQFMDTATSRAGSPVPARGQFAWGDLDAPSPSPAALREASRQAWAQLRMTRRWLGSPLAAVNGRYAAHYLLSRSMGLRLLTQRRIAAPFFDLDHLTRVYLREFPDAARALASIPPESGARSVDEAYWACHDFLESALAETMR